MTTPSWLIEEYVSPFALPGEQITGWVKWDTSVKVQKVNLRLEADVEIERIFNVEDDAIREKAPGLFELRREDIQ